MKCITIVAEEKPAEEKPAPPEVPSWLPAVVILGAIAAAAYISKR